MEKSIKHMNVTFVHLCIKENKNMNVIMEFHVVHEHTQLNVFFKRFLDQTNLIMALGVPLSRLISRMLELPNLSGDWRRSLLAGGGASENWTRRGFRGAINTSSICDKDGWLRVGLLFYIVRRMAIYVPVLWIHNGLTP